MPKQQPIEIFMPPNMLKAKVGGSLAGVDMAAIKRAEAALEKLKAEFAVWIEADVSRLADCRDAFEAEPGAETRGDLYRASSRSQRSGADLRISAGGARGGIAVQAARRTGGEIAADADRRPCRTPSASSCATRSRPRATRWPCCFPPNSKPAWRNSWRRGSKPHCHGPPSAGRPVEFCKISEAGTGWPALGGP